MSITMSFGSTTRNQEAGSSSSFELPQPCRQLTFSEIKLATKNFDESLVIGRGGFGKVYKGTITYGNNHLTVAIKRLDSTSSQGASEFWSEVKMLSKLRQCHLVSLIGYCNDGQEMILVYEYMTHGTLEDHLHKGRFPLTWVRRLKICIGAARGLDYLHTGTGIKHGVIHRDVKSSNILLDDSWAAKISDFGLSKVGPTNQPCTYVSTQVKGTFGYLDPDYYQTGRLTRKSDVYAFGVVLFEVLCGKRAVDSSIDEDQWGLAGWAHDSIKEGRLNQIVDPDMIRQRITPKCLKDFSRLADQCLHNHPKHRPTMAEVVVDLEYVLALQEKENSKFQPLGMTLFGSKVPMFVFPSKGNSDGDISLISFQIYLDTIQGENQIFHRFDFATINVATENLSEANKFSYDGYAAMYKGKLQNGKAIAIAEFYGSTPRRIKYYMNEALILLKLEHENLAMLIGYCIEGTQRFLVYEFAHHSNLDRFIFDNRSTLLDWNKRYKIILSVARVLVYLHKHAPIRIIHCNLHPGNIWLDESFDPILSDFGFATPINETDCIHVDVIRGSTRVLAPEYITNGHLSTKVDVFSFGVLLLEILTGRRVIGADKDLVSRNWLEGTSSNVIDSRIDADSSLMKIFIEIGLLCLQRDASDRPTMEEVVDMLLANSSLTLPVSKMRENMIKGSSKSFEEPVDDYDTSAVEEYMSDLSPR